MSDRIPPGASPHVAATGCGPAPQAWVPANYPVSGIPGVVVQQVDELPSALPGGSSYSPQGEANGGILLLRAEGIGRFRISHGTRIEFSVDPDSPREAVNHVLWGSALAGLIHQRGELPLHASCVVSPDKSHALAFCGPSGSGKSTMAATLWKRGWQILTDDLCRITWTGDRLLAWPGIPVVRLLPDACERLAVSGPEAIGKAVISVEPEICPAPLTAIIVLGGDVLGDDGAPPGTELISGGAALAALAGNVSSPNKLRATGRLEQHFALMRKVVEHCRILRLHGRKVASAEALSDIVCKIAVPV